MLSKHDEIAIEVHALFLHVDQLEHMGNLLDILFALFVIVLFVLELLVVLIDCSLHRLLQLIADPHLQLFEHVEVLLFEDAGRLLLGVCCHDVDQVDALAHEVDSRVQQLYVEYASIPLVFDVVQGLPDHGAARPQFDDLSQHVQRVLSHPLPLLQALDALVHNLSEFKAMLQVRIDGSPCLLFQHSHLFLKRRSHFRS